MRQYFIILCVLMFVLPVHPVFAQVCCHDARHNWYFGADAGLAAMQDYDTSQQGIGGTPAKLVFNRPGYNFNGQLGYRLNPFWRVEGELGYYTFHINKNKTQNVNFAALSSGQEYEGQTAVAAMGNLYFDVHNDTHYTPYLGIGGGIMHVHNPLSVTLNTGETEKLIDWTPAVQFMAGVSYQLQSPNLIAPMEVTLGYRYVKAQEAEIELKSVPGGSIGFDNTTQDVELGLRVYF